MANNQMAVNKINNDLKEILHSESSVEGVFVELIDKSNVFEWRVWLEGPHDTPYHNGIFKCKLSFPQTYPMEPPTLVFETQIWHPNVYEDGKVCISILHPPGRDEMNPDEPPEARWLPSHTAVTIAMCVLSMIGEPNINSPANVSASVMWRDRRGEFIKKAEELVKKSLAELPPGIKEKIPHPDTDPVQKKQRIEATLRRLNPQQSMFGEDLNDDTGDLIAFDDDDPVDDDPVDGDDVPADDD